MYQKYANTQTNILDQRLTSLTEVAVPRCSDKSSSLVLVFETWIWQRASMPDGVHRPSHLQYLVDKCTDRGTEREGGTRRRRELQTIRYLGTVIEV